MMLCRRCHKFHTTIDLNSNLECCAANVADARFDEAFGIDGLMALPETLRVFDVDAPLPRFPHSRLVCRALIVYQLCC